MTVFQMKSRISYRLLEIMLRRNIEIAVIAKELKISQAKILELINPSVYVLDLEVFTKVCEHLNINIRINGTL